MRTVRPLVIGLCVGALAFACDHSPTAGPSPSLLAARTNSTSKSTGLVVCSQTYDSVTQVMGPRGGFLTVGAHTLYVDSLVLMDTVSITAVAPAGTVRWARFHPDGLLFPANLVDGWGAALITSYKDCGVPTSDTLRIAQVTDSLSILSYLQTWSQVKKVPWSQGQQRVVGLLPHFSNYAIAW